MKTAKSLATGDKVKLNKLLSTGSKSTEIVLSSRPVGGALLYTITGSGAEYHVGEITLVKRASRKSLALAFQSLSVIGTTSTVSQAPV